MISTGIKPACLRRKYTNKVTYTAGTPKLCANERGLKAAFSDLRTQSILSRLN